LNGFLALLVIPAGMKWPGEQSEWGVGMYCS